MFDRGKRLRRFMDAHPEHSYYTSDTDRVCDLWMVICGCSRICAETKGLKARWKTVALWNEDGFLRMEQEIKQAEEFGQNAGEKRILQVKDRTVRKYPITEQDAAMFGKITKDGSSLHTDRAIALQAGFENPPVYGMYLDSLVSAVMGSDLPGSGTIYMEHMTRFIRPVYAGDEVEITVEFISCEEQEDCYIGEFRAGVRNQRGERVLTANCRQKLMKTFFSVREAAGKEE